MGHRPHRPQNIYRRVSNEGVPLDIIELLKSAFMGLVEGITEWLPVSSTGHMILVDEFVKMNVSETFWNMFLVVIQLGAILAVCVLFFHELNPFSPSKGKEGRRDTWVLWGKIVLGCIPAAAIGLPLNDWLDEHFYNYVVVAIALIVYGIIFIWIETRYNYKPTVQDFDQMSYLTAFKIGCFQVLAIVPGTSRSGSTILGAILIGVGRSAGAEFSFFMAIPTMLGASAIKGLKFLLSGVAATGTEIGVLIVGCVVSFVVSLLVIRGLMEYVRRHSFSAFGVYRILLGVVVLVYFALAG